MKIQVNK